MPMLWKTFSHQALSSRDGSVANTSNENNVDNIINDVDDEHKQVRENKLQGDGLTLVEHGSWRLASSGRRGVPSHPIIAF
eukprot:4260351-Pleurochrysis_carterae.AAC.3